MRNRTILIPVILVLLAACAAVADTGTTLFDVTYVQSAANAYTFTLWNRDNTGIVPVGLWLEWSAGTPNGYMSTNIDAPAGWSRDYFYAAFYPAWSWDGAPGSEINGPTSSLSGFVVHAASAPTMFTVSINDADGNPLEDQLGTAQLTVPEPSAAVPILGALGVFVTPLVRRRTGRRP